MTNEISELASKIERGEELNFKDIERIIIHYQKVMSVNDETRRKLLKSGHQQCIVQFFTTNLVVDVVSFIEKCLRMHFLGAMVNFIRLDPPILVSPLRPISGQNGSVRPIFLCKSLGVMGENYIEIILPKTENLKDVSEVGMKAAAIVRAIFGTLAAGSLHYEMEMDMDTGERSTTHWPMILVNEEKFFGDLMDDPTLPAPELSIKESTLRLMAESDRHDDATNFLFKWLAIEAQLGNGKMRENFCIDILGSELINYEMRELFSKRNAFFHEGSIPDYTDFDQLSISSMLRIALMDAGPMRDRLRDRYEDRILALWNGAHYPPAQ